MDAETLTHALAPLPVGPVRYYAQIGSTNTEAARWAEAGAPDLALVVADEQTAGRGRFKRRWFTPPGSALAFSLVLRRMTKVGTVFEPYMALPRKQSISDEGRKRDEESGFSRLTALGALAVREALEARWGLPAQIKWPNDVLVDGRKLAGILVEAHWQGDQLSAAILGIGINVAPASVPPPGALKYPATSVADCLEQRGYTAPPDRLELLVEVLKHLVAWRSRLASEEFLQAWEGALAFRGEWVTVDQGAEEIGEGDPGASRRDGQILGLARDGAPCACVTAQARNLPYRPAS